MRDELLFVVAPRLAAVCCVLALVKACLPIGARGSAGVPASGSGCVRCWRVSIALVLLGHVLAFAFPETVMLWNRQVVRLLFLETFGIAVGSIALLSMLVSRVRHRGGNGSTLDVIAANLIAVELLSGLTLAVRYPWASSWAAVTLTPYVRSLFGSEPSVVLVARMPFVVQLHVFCAFALLAIVPFTSAASPLIASIRELARLASAPFVRPPLPAWDVASLRTAADKPGGTATQYDKERQP